MSNGKRAGKVKNKKMSQVRSGVPSGPLLNQPPIPADVVKDPEELMKLAFKRAMIGGNFLDTKFYAYSRRKSSGVIYAPKAIHANSYILRAKEPQYFEPLLRGGYDGYSINGPLNGPFPDEFPAEIDGDGYESDSDIEDDAEYTQDDEKPPSMFDNAPSNTTEEDKKPDAINEDTQEHAEGETEVVAGGSGRVRMILTFAFPTWQAFVYYVTTGEIQFSRLKSQLKVAESSPMARRRSETLHPTSPKSMYRLADELGLHTLKDLAKKDIESKLSADNILAELFSSFTAKYDAIQQLEVDFACTKAKDVVARGLYEWMSSVRAEDLKRNAGVLARLFQKMAGVGTSNPASGRPTSCPSCRYGANGYAFYLRCGNCNYNL